MKLVPELGACCEFRRHQKVQLLHPLTSPGRWENATALVVRKSTGPHRNLEGFGLLFAFHFNLVPAPKLMNKKQQEKVESWEFHRLPVRESHKLNKLQVTFMHLYFFPTSPLSCLFFPVVRGKDSI